MNRIQTNIENACSGYKDGLHYPDFIEVFGKLTLEGWHTWEELRENEELFIKFISPGSATMNERTVSSVIDKMEETYTNQGNKNILDFFDINDDPIIEKYLSRIMDQDKEYPLPEAILNIIQNGNTIPLLTIEGISLWQGKQKSKKTTLLAMCVAEYISGRESILPIRFERKIPGKILFFDCEQGSAYAARTMKLILKLAGVRTSGNLRYIDLRRDTPIDRKTIIEAACEYENDVRWVIIDGVVDLMNDFMSDKEGHQLAMWMLRLASNYNIHVSGILHQNKNDENARAHVGSILSQKCEIEISATVKTAKPEESEIKCVNNRGLKFKPFTIVWEINQMPKIQSKSDVTKELQILATQVFKVDKLLGRGEIEARLKVILKSSSKGAKQKTSEMIGVVIEKSGEGHFDKYKRTNEIPLAIED